MSLGVANTESGHCAKTMSIIHHLGGWASKQSNPPSWYVIADDDTIIGYRTVPFRTVLNPVIIIKALALLLVK